MIVLLKNNKTAGLRFLDKADAEKLFAYLNGLSDETRQRFGPHPFDRDTVDQLINHPPSGEWRIVAEEIPRGTIIGYGILKLGYLLHDAERLSAYGLQLSHTTDCTFAPSVADAWQSSGLGSRLFEFILDQIRIKNYRRIILWGGVQASNEKAVRYYQKFGFRVLGEFDYNGRNYDMIKEL